MFQHTPPAVMLVAMITLLLTQTGAATTTARLCHVAELASFVSVFDIDTDVCTGSESEISIGFPYYSPGTTSIPLAIETVVLLHSAQLGSLTSLAAIAKMLLGPDSWGGASLLFDAITRTSVRMEDLTLVVSPALTPVLRDLHSRGLIPFTSLDAPELLRTDRKVIRVKSDNEAVRLVLSHGEDPVDAGIMAFVPYTAASGSVVTPLIHGGISLPFIIPPSDVHFTHVHVNFTSGEAAPLSQAAVYPFLLLVTINVPAAFQDTNHSSLWHALVKRVLATPGSSPKFPLARVSALSDYHRVHAWRIAKAHTGRTLLTPAPTFPGSSMTVDTVSRWAASEIEQGHEDPLLYVGTCSEKSIDAVRNGGAPFAISELLLPGEPKLTYVPALVVVMSLVANLPGTFMIAVPMCSVVDVFNGTIAHWDHPILAAANANIKLPHMPIRLVVSQLSSGAMSIFKDGIDRLAAHCPRGSQSLPEGWLPRDALQADTDHDVLQFVHETPYSLGFALDANSDHSETQVNLLSGSQILTTDAHFVHRTLNHATLHPNNEVRFDNAGPHAYPFVRASYLAFRHPNDDDGANCQSLRRGLEFVQWAQHDVDHGGLGAHDGQGIIALPHSVSEFVLQYIRSMQCDGKLLIGEAQAPSPSEGLSQSEMVWVSVTVALGALFVTLLIVLGIVHTHTVLADRHNSRELADAPPSGEIAFVITDIHDSGRLWGVCPRSMSAAVEIHDLIVRSIIRRHHAYEVQSLGDGFVVAAKNAVTAVTIAIEIQGTLQREQWPAAINSVYKNDEATFDDPAQLSPATREGDASVMNGPRVGIGIHVGQAEAMRDVKRATVEYSGPGLIVASRTHSLVDGGQILLTGSVRKNIREMHLKTRFVGSLDVAGIRDSQDIFALRTELLRKRFPKLKKLKKSATTSYNRQDFHPLGSAVTTRPSNFVHWMLRALSPHERRECIDLLATRWKVPRNGLADDDEVVSALCRTAFDRPVVEAPEADQSQSASETVSVSSSSVPMTPLGALASSAALDVLPPQGASALWQDPDFY